MKRISTILLVLIICFSLFSCGKTEVSLLGEKEENGLNGANKKTENPAIETNETLSAAAFSMEQSSESKEEMIPEINSEDMPNVALGVNVTGTSLSDSDSDLDRFTSEKINGEPVVYADYTTVVIENYRGENTSLLEDDNYTTPIYEKYPTICHVAFFGKVTNITYKSVRQDTVFGPYKVADQIINTNLTVNTGASAGKRIDVIGFYDVNNNYHEILIGESSEEIHVIKQ